jgi:modulator of FtsH protease HflC
MRASSGAIGVIAIVLAMLAAAALYTVDERQNAIVFQFGEMKEVVTTPGLHVKMPLVQNVRFFDKRILTLDTPEAERVITAGNVPILVDSFVKWRIRDVKQFYLATRGVETTAQSRLAGILNSELKDEFGRRELQDIIATERDSIMERMRERANAGVKDLGIEIVDVRIKRIELPQDTAERVFARMESERRRSEPGALGRLRRGREDSCRCRPSAFGDSRGSLQRRAAGEGRGRREGCGDLQRRVQQERGVLRVLSQPRCVQGVLQEQGRYHGG